jgi:hypothetical protein
VGFAQRAADGLENLPNLVVADYVSLPTGYWLGSPYDALAIDGNVRGWIEANHSQLAAQTILERLPTSPAQMEALLERGSAVAQAMSWDVVARDYLLPGLRRAQ